MIPAAEAIGNPAASGVLWWRDGWGTMPVRLPSPVSKGP